MVYTNRMSDSRIVTIRTSDNINPGVLRTPFVYLHPQYGYPVDSIMRQTPTIPLVNIGTYPNTFPNTVQSYNWIQGGAPGSLPWIAIGQLKNGLYFSYSAYCNTGFFDKSDGHMNLWVSIRYSDLIHHTLDNVTYERYLKETKE